MTKKQEPTAEPGPCGCERFQESLYGATFTHLPGCKNAPKPAHGYLCPECHAWIADTPHGKTDHTGWCKKPKEPTAERKPASDEELAQYKEWIERGPLSHPLLSYLGVVPKLIARIEQDRATIERLEQERDAAVKLSEAAVAMVDEHQDFVAKGWPQSGYTPAFSGLRVAVAEYRLRRRAEKGGA